MSKERKFHQFIEKQNREEKDRVWEKIQQKETERLAPKKETRTVPPNKKPFPWRKWATVAASSLVVVLLGVFALVKFFPWDSNEPNNNRYFTNQSYQSQETQTTLKGYSEEIGENLLYFDWYLETDYVKDYVWQLKDTEEIICFREVIVDINTGCTIELLVTEADTTLEALSSDENTDRESEIKGTKINWTGTSIRAYGNFEYEEYRYYLRVEEPIDENYILTLIEELLP